MKKTKVGFGKKKAKKFIKPNMDETRDQSKLDMSSDLLNVPKKKSRKKIAAISPSNRRASGILDGPS